MKGVEDTYVLSEEDKEKILELEKKADGAVLMGLGVGDNQGIKEVFKRQIIIAFTTNMDYVWPEGPNVVLMQYGEKIGEDIYDSKKLEECKKCEDMLVMGNLVIYKNAVPKPGSVKKRTYNCRPTPTEMSGCRVRGRGDQCCTCVSIHPIG